MVQLAVIVSLAGMVLLIAAEVQGSCEDLAARREEVSITEISSNTEMWELQCSLPSSYSGPVQWSRGIPPQDPLPQTTQSIRIRNDLSSEDNYTCCVCDATICASRLVYVNPVESGPLHLSTYIQDSLSIPCGIMFGRLHVSYIVSWEVRLGGTLLMYHSSQGNRTITDGVYSYHPDTFTLHVENFLGFDGRRGEVLLTCTVTLEGDSRQPSIQKFRHITITLYYVKFRVKLPKLKAGSGTRLRLQVIVESRGDLAEVDWMVAGEIVSPGPKYAFDNSHVNHSGSLFNQTSTLEIRGFSDSDTSSEVMVLASLQNATDNSSTQIIKLPKIKNLRVECNAVRPGMLNLLFDLPPKFPHFRLLGSKVDYDLTIQLHLRSFDEQRNPHVWPPIPVRPYDILNRPIPERHGLHLSRGSFPRQGTHWLQAKLSINGQISKQWSSECNHEKNVLRLSENSCGGDSDGVSGGSIERLLFILNFTRTWQPCDSMNTTVIYDILMRYNWFNFCSELLEDSFLHCNSSSLGMLSLNLFSLTPASRRRVTEPPPPPRLPPTEPMPPSPLPFTVLSWEELPPPPLPTDVPSTSAIPPITTPSLSLPYNSDYQSKTYLIVGVVVGMSVFLIIVLVLVGMLYIKWSKRKTDSDPPQVPPATTSHQQHSSDPPQVPPATTSHQQQSQNTLHLQQV